MAIVNGSLQEGYKDAAWFAANPTLILLVGQKVNLEQSGTYKLGDGVTALSALSFLGSGSDVPLGLIKIVDLAGDFFTDLATASAYVSTFNVAGTISDESYSNGIYYFTVPQGSDFSGDSFFLSLGPFTTTTTYIIDSIGLITVFSHSLCLNNNGNNVFRNITFGGDSFTLSSGINIYNNISADTPSFDSASGKFIFNGTVLATGIYLSDFFLSSTATILTNKDNLGNTALIQAASNGANVQYDGINLLTSGGWIDISTVVTAVGFSSSTVLCWYKITNGNAFVYYNITGTSNATNFQIADFPFTANSNQPTNYVAISVTNNGVASTTSGRVRMDASDNKLIFQRDQSGATWTNTGTKASAGQIMIML